MHEPLPRIEVVNAIERRSPARIPLVRTLWWGEGLESQYGDRLRTLEQRYPEDVVQLFVPNPCQMVADRLPWELRQGGGLDNCVMLEDWARLDEFLACLPDPSELDWAPWRAQAAAARQADRYVISGWWRFFFEMPWTIRGMENLFCDYYIYPEEVHRLHSGMVACYRRWCEAIVDELQPDGFFTSDDLGNQRQPMIKPDIFRTFLLPYYQEITGLVHDAGAHVWLHSCGDNTALLDDLIEGGVDVFHPVQKGCMDAATVAASHGDRLAWLAGFDVQHVLQEGTPEAVRAEVRALVDTLDGPAGGCLLAAGNGIVAGTPWDNIVAFLDEAQRYSAGRRTSPPAEVSGDVPQ